MEELQSTEVLDREILEDARKKAQRIFKSAEEAAASSAAAWEKKSLEAIEEIRQNYIRRGERSRTEIMARLPLDKRRIYSEKVETLLCSAMDNCFAELSREKLLALLERELKVRTEEFIRDQEPSTGTPDGVPVEISGRGLSDAELEDLLDRTLPGIPRKVRQNFPFHNLPGSFPAVVADTPAVRLIASIDALSAALLQDHRAELAGALLGPEALE
jgi:vacuolar-type H+-ATPase subunit H